jgi:beta-galactosidase
LRPGLKHAVSGKISGFAERWQERIETSAEMLATFEDGSPALIGKDNVFYLGCWLEPDGLGELMALLCRKAGLSTIALPPEVRLRRRGELTFVFNYGEASWRAPFTSKPLLGARDVLPRSFTVWRE